MTAKQTNKKAKTDSFPSLISNNKLLAMYETMLKCRILDAHVAQLTGTRTAWKGKEAAIAGAVIDLLPGDKVAVTNGSSVIRLAKGARLDSLFRDLHAKPADKKAKPSRIAPSANVTVQGGVAAGLCLAGYKASPESVTVVFLSGKGKVSPDWQAPFLFASAKKLPLIGICDAADVDESQFASLPFPAIPVDGSDVVAVYRVAFEGLQRVRRGGGPNLIVCKQVPPAAGGSHAPDPIRSMEKYLAGKKLFVKERRQRVIDTFEAAIKQASARARKTSGRTTLSEMEDVVLL